MGFFSKEASNFKSTFKLGLGEVDCTLGISIWNQDGKHGVQWFGLPDGGGYFPIYRKWFLPLIAEEAADGIEEQGVREERKRNVIQTSTNLWETNWGKTLLIPATADIETWEGKKFRRRFRMDYRMFREVLVPMCKEINVFEMEISNHQYPVIQIIWN